MTHEAVTLDSILSLPAGLELDAIVAERVMGLLTVKERWPIAWHTGKALSIDPEDVALWRDCLFIGSQTNSEGDRHTVPHYSTSITAAWEVVEKLKSTFTRDRSGRAIGFDLNYSSIFNVWSVNLIVDEMGPVERIDGSTAPLAICRAAVKAVRGNG